MDLGVQSLSQRAVIYAVEFHVNGIIALLKQRFAFRTQLGHGAVATKWRPGYMPPCR